MAELVSALVVVNGSVAVVFIVGVLVNTPVGVTDVRLADVINSVVVLEVDNASVVDARYSEVVVCGTVTVVCGCDVDVVATSVTDVETDEVLCAVDALVDNTADDVGETTVEVTAAEEDGTSVVGDPVESVVGSDVKPVVDCSSVVENF